MVCSLAISEGVSVFSRRAVISQVDESLSVFADTVSQWAQGVSTRVTEYVNYLGGILL